MGLDNADDLVRGVGMTTVAWDGRTLAADKRVSFGSRIATVTKVHRVNGHLVAGAGSSAQINEMIEWFRHGARPETFPAKQRTDDGISLLVITPEGKALQYSNTPYPIEHGDSRVAIGSGCEFAMAAMHCGKTAREAVEVAAILDSNTGNGVDVLHLQGDAPRYTLNIGEGAIVNGAINLQAMTVEQEAPPHVPKPGTTEWCSPTPVHRFPLDPSVND